MQNCSSRRRQGYSQPGSTLRGQTALPDPNLRHPMGGTVRAGGHPLAALTRACVVRSHSPGRAAHLHTDL